MVVLVGAVVLIQRKRDERESGNSLSLDFCVSKCSSGGCQRLGTAHLFDWGVRGLFLGGCFLWFGGGMVSLRI